MTRSALLLLFVSVWAHAGSFTANPVATCSQLKAANNAKVLVIAFEGRDQYDDKRAEAIFDYVGRRKTAMPPDRLPQLQGKGILTDGLLFPIAQAFGDRIDIVTFATKDFDSKQFDNAMDCARIWMKNSDKTGNKLVLIGHSHGASRVANMGPILFQEDIPLNTLITIDGLPIDGHIITRPPGVETYLNYYQDDNTDILKRMFMSGQEVDGANNEVQLVTDVSGHFSITESPTVISGVKAQLERLVGPAQMASAN